MKKQILLTLAFYLLLIANASDNDDDCSFTVDQLNNQILKPDSTDCQNCFTSDVTMSIQADSQQITSITLTANDKSSPLQQLNLQPAEKSLTIDTSFRLQGQNMLYGYNFMNLCATSKVNGKLTYVLGFQAKVQNTYQTFFLSSEGVVLNLSYLILALCSILLFV
ncbi:transmembrane protein, putative (macronuclear) [Tetrahymena thermophila SB210]|uniref:Transmembrane protein, putative n=1 Tax=Tetrahymena thermophila (strain SB210) TaxID=312017 RepID=Q22T10_TETTS|nr:transmembrane protein, putative [Tetrahymena thermophila SB210]EAR88628.1 transmembrane protein, putative [Tetrahymena thermophila SB210]|eukprot:XP_001008873.1 transmembrane protein, putative [Tetrahymena thermophila SB210]